MTVAKPVPASAPAGASGPEPTGFDALLALAHTLADAAGDAIRPHFRAPIGVDNKAGAGGFDPVTAADRGGEAAIIRLLATCAPTHRLLGEEYGTAGGNGRHTWVVDPIDGTRAFILGLPTWGTLIGLLADDTPVLGLMDQPYTRERFWSTADGAVWRDASGVCRPLATRPCPDLAAAHLATTHPDLFAAGPERDVFERLKSRARMSRYGTDCYAYAMLAAGFIDVVVEAGLKPHDIVALIPIIERAGGRITTWDGRPATGGGRILACGDPALHEALLADLNR